LTTAAQLTQLATLKTKLATDNATLASISTRTAFLVGTAAAQKSKSVPPASRLCVSRLFQIPEIFFSLFRFCFTLDSSTY